MAMDSIRGKLARSLTVASAITATLAPLAGARAEHGDHEHPVKHVIVISVDGLHQSDLAYYVEHHPQSTLARLVHEGASYTNARTPFPSDSFPGLTAIVTGANPKTAGVYYDDSYNRNLLAAGTTDCVNTAPGTEVTYFEALDRNPLAIDAGYGVGDISTSAAIKANIYKLPGNAQALINPAALPVDPVTCKGVYPHSYLHVNTVFEVAKAHGLHTAWSDKHAAYDLVNGPSGTGVDDLFAPEINSDLPADLGSTGDDFTKDNLNTQFYDSLKVQAVLNWAHGGNHDGSPNAAGAPAIYGMNFQTVSTAQKLNFSRYAGAPGNATGLGGYTNGGTEPGVVLSGALDYVDASMAKIVEAAGKDTAIILTAKHGQSPVDRAKLRLIDDGEVTGALDAAWNAAHHTSSGLVAFSINDDGLLIWLQDRSPEAAEFAKSFLWNYSPVHVGGSNPDGSFKDYSGTVQHSGVRRIYAGTEASEFIGVAHDDERVPDVIGIAQVGTVYSSPLKIKKIAEHGGDAHADRHVPIVVWGPGVEHGVRHEDVETTQVATTTLKLLGLPVSELKAVAKEGTKVLPDVR